MSDSSKEKTEEQEKGKQAVEDFDDILEEALSEPGAPKAPLDVREIPLDDIGERDNIRPAYHGIEGLAETMHLQGQLQPCLVRPTPDGASHGKPFELVCGHRRRRAAEFLRERGLAGWETIRCEVKDIPDDSRIRKTIVENFQREELSPVAEARAMQELKFTTDPPMSNIEIAKALGCDPSQVSHRLKLLSLAPPPPKVTPKPTPESGEETQTELSKVADQDVADENMPSISDDDVFQSSGVSSGVVTQEETVFAEENLETVDHAITDEDSDDSAEPEVPEKPAVDILDMVDKGEISASTAEVIASLEEREQQEKLAILAKRGQWSTKKAASWARDVKENIVDEGVEDLGPVDMIQMEDVVELMHLHPKADITDDEIAQITCYALLRNGMDREMLDYLEDKMGVPYEELWDYVSSLSIEDTRELTRRLAVRYISAAHRWFSLEPSLKDHFGVPETSDDPDLTASAAELEVSLPGAGDMSSAPQKQDASEVLDDLLSDE
jgi:ParB/RepB/Spo0J family partition protein